MAEVNEKVMTMVRDEIQKNPEVKTEELFEKAKKLDKSVASLSRRAFHARYPLQVKRQMAPARRKGRGRAGRRGSAAAAANREAVRGVLLQFARDIAAAEDTASLVNVIGGIDRYVDKVLKSVGRG